MNSSLALKMRYKRLPFLFVYVIGHLWISDLFGNICSEVVHLRDLVSAQKNDSIDIF